MIGRTRRRWPLVGVPIGAVWLVVVLAACASGAPGSTSGKGASGYSPPRSAPCPKKHLSQVRSENRRARAQLVPGGVIAAQVCRYSENGTGGRGVHLEIDESRVSTPAAANRLAAPFRQLSDVAEGEVECPSGAGVWYLVSFFYRGEAPVHLHVSLIACGSVENSLYETVYYPSSGVERALEAAVEPAR